MALVVTVESRGKLAIVELAGELDIATAPQAGQALTDALSAGHTAIIFDLSGLAFCDSTGLRLLVRAHRELTTAGGRLAIAGATGMVAQVLQVSGLTEIFGSFPTLAEAVNAVRLPR